MREGLYFRMVVWTMTHEKPLPLAIKDVCAIARITNGQQAFAVRDLLAEFFTQQADGWHQKTSDEVLTWWRDSGRDASVTRRSGTRTRMTALRSRIADMRNALAQVGVKTHSRQGVTELTLLCQDHGVTGYVTRNTPVRDALRDVVRDAYIQNPVTQSPPSGAPVAPAQAVEDDRPGPYTLALRALEEAGMTDAYPGHSVFVELVAAGVPPRTFKATALEAKTRGKGFGWAMAAIKGRLADAAAKPANGAASAPGPFDGGLVTPEGRARLEAAIADPARDPWELPPISGPPSPTKHEPT